MPRRRRRPVAAAAVRHAAASEPGTTPITPKTVTPEVPVDPAGSSLGAITDVEQDGASVTLTAEHGAMRVSFLDDRTFRLEADPSGEFTDPANTPQDDPARTADIVVGAESFDGADVDRRRRRPDHHLDGRRHDRRRPRHRHVLGDARRRLGHLVGVGADHVRRLLRDAAPRAGRRRAVHRRRHAERPLGAHGRHVNIARNFDWDDDGYPNAVPYYMSSNGYGVLRNTFARGSYDFAAHTTTHEERRFDAYYFVGDYKASLESYTQLTGRPMMPPGLRARVRRRRLLQPLEPARYSGYGGPARSCAPRRPSISRRSFVEHDMPAGWMLVNDGYGCEYQELPETVDAIEDADRISRPASGRSAR